MAGRRSLVILPFIVLFAAGGLIVVTMSPGKPTARELQDTYEAALAGLRFPDGRAPREVDPNTLGHEVPDAAMGILDAGNAWFCAWGIEWKLARDTERAKARGDLQVLADAYPDGLFWQTLRPPDGAVLHDELMAAIEGRGEDAVLREIAAFGCES